jgi:hypothetical protein
MLVLLSIGARSRARRRGRAYSGLGMDASASTGGQTRRSARRIGPVGTSTRLLVAAGLLYLALFKGTSWGGRWYDLLLGLVVLPGVMLTLALVARRRGSGPLRLTGSTATVLNCAVIIALLVDPYTGRGAELFYGATLLVAALRGQPGCESTVLSNAILRRDDQVGCPVFSPIDRLEARHHLRRTRENAAA